DIKIIKNQDYDRIISGERFFISEIGNPELPVSVKSYIVPIDASDVRVNIQNVIKQKIIGQYTIYPVQPPVPVDDTEPPSFVEPNKKIYDSELPYPGKVAEIIADYFYLGYRIITVQSYPFEYIPRTKELYTCNFDFSVDYSMSKRADKEIFSTQNQTLYRYELNKKAVKFRVENPDMVDNYDTKVKNIVQGKAIVYTPETTSNSSSLRSQSISVLDEQIPDYIIITGNALKLSFQPLANWKTKKGIFTLIQTVEKIDSVYQGSDLQEKIRKYIIDSRSKWGNGLYILLGGDINIVPPRMIPGTKSLSYPADMYYATYTGTWNNNNDNIFGDGKTSDLGVVLGRVSVENEEETATFVNKLISYEKANNISNSNYFTNNLYADAYTFESNGVLSDFGQDSIKVYNNIYVPSYINKKYICDNANCITSTRYSQNPCPGGDIELNHDNFLSALNSGGSLGVGKFHFIYHMDHSSPTAISASGKDKGQILTKAEIANLSNGNSYQILMSGGCNTANFQYDCISEAYLTNPNGGGVAWIGNTDVGYSNEYNQLQAFCDAIYTTSKHPSMARYDIGSAFQNVLNYTYPVQLYKTDWRLHLLGDPEMQVWTNTPQDFNVTVSPTSIQTGAHILTVTVSGLTLPSGESALICLSKGTEVFETQTISGNGSYTFPVNAETTGTLDVTVTAHNYKPVEKTISVTTSTAANLLIDSINFVDNGSFGSIGNGNGQNDAGETIRLQTIIKNNGATAATGLTATLSRNSDSITMLSSTSSLNNIAAGSSATGTFLYQIHKDMHETLSNSPHPITFQLQITSSSGSSWTKTFNIDVFAADLKQRNKIIANAAASSFDLQIELQNTGKALTSALTGYLYFNNDSIAATFPGINYLETKWSDTIHIPLPFTSGLTFTLKVKNSFDKTWSSTFNLAKPNPVTGLDFTAAEKSISLMWNVVGSAGGYNIYRCDADSAGNESGSYVKLNPAPVTFAFYNDDSGLNSLTRYNYKIAAVSPSEMEGNTSAILAWTSLKNKNLFPVTTSFEGLGRGINVADINHDGYQEIFVASKKGILEGLNYEGNELYDIDNNVTTYSGFIDLGIPIWGKPAIGDLWNNGKYQIVEPSRTLTSQANRLFIISSEDENQDGIPDMISQAETNPTNSHAPTSAILANIDNSPDLSLEIIVNYENGSIFIYNADGTVRNNSLYAAGNVYGAIAVADMDNDGYMEIIKAAGNGIYIWRHDGSNFNPNAQPVYSIDIPDFQFKSSVNVCDIDNDGNKEMIAVALKQTISYQGSYQGKLYAIKTDGTIVQNWELSTFDHYSYQYAPYFSIGDLNADGNLEIVMAGNGRIGIYNNHGYLHKDIAIAGFQEYGEPILADIDGDPDIELVVNSSENKFIYAYKMNGEKVLGFPIAINDVSYNSVCVSDIDNDGKNELLAATGNTIYMWATEGNPFRIESGTIRQNHYNTGEYKTFCLPTIITGDATWNSNQHVCGDIIIRHC
ncbi:MAG: C25 family cysteine peptidase, partial [Dysgonamonadaceae bacterium]|nr:C25 family cysteine peptidase [Dysgonamonadaceae bacterium]